MIYSGDSGGESDSGTKSERSSSSKTDRASETFNSTSSEGGDMIELPMAQEHPLIVLFLVRYLYTKRYNIRGNWDSRIMDVRSRYIYVTPVNIHALVFTAAKKYEMHKLAELALDAFKQELGAGLEVERTNDAARHRRVVKILMSMIQSNTVGKAHPEILEHILKLWTKNECRLVRHYTTAADFDRVLRAFPEVRDELTKVSPDGQVKYEGVSQGEAEDFERTA